MTQETLALPLGRTIKALAVSLLPPALTVGALAHAGAQPEVIGTTAVATWLGALRPSTGWQWNRYQSHLLKTMQLTGN